MDDAENSVGCIIKKHRESRGWTLDQMSNELIMKVRQYSPSYISAVENGRKLASPEFVARMEKFFGMEPKSLWIIARQEHLREFQKRLDEYWTRKIPKKYRTT